MLRRLPTKLALSLLVALSWQEPTEAYEFDVRTTTVGQLSNVQADRLLSPSAWLRRRRISQSLALSIWDLSGTRSAFTPRKTQDEPHWYLSSYLRLDHEMGSFLNQELLLSGRYRDALDAIPELEPSSIALDLLYGYAGVEGLWNRRFDAQFGRLLFVDSMDWYNLDGARVNLHLNETVGVSAFAGLRVREGGYLASPIFAPDGTSGAFCQEFVEGPMPRSGSWRPIDGLPARPRSPFTSDDEVCPQRDQLMQSAGTQLSYQGNDTQAHLGYRRSWSSSPGLLAEPERLDYEDIGYYPQIDGTSRGVNEEFLSASFRTRVSPSKTLALMPYAALRHSLAHGQVDQGHAGLQLEKGDKRIESELFYSAPTFDLDSIFNVFSSEPYWDFRNTYRQRLAGGSFYARLWGRRYHSEDSQAAGLSGNRYSGGLQSGGRIRVREGWRLEGQGFGDEGYGGRRLGGALASSVAVTRDTTLRSRLISFYLRREQGDEGELQLGTQVAVDYRINRGIELSLILEQNSHPVDRFQLASFALLDMNFQPITQ